MLDGVIEAQAPLADELQDHSRDVGLRHAADPEPVAGLIGRFVLRSATPEAACHSCPSWRWSAIAPGTPSLTSRSSACWSAGGAAEDGDRPVRRAGEAAIGAVTVWRMELRDDAIVLRPWRQDDARAVYLACQDRELQRWVPVIPRPYTHDDAHAFVTGAGGPGRHELAITERGQVVGSIALRVNDSNTGRIGYWCTSEARGRGITTRALRRLCRHALEELGLARLELVTDTDNVASQRVAEKVGFQREGVLRSHLAHPDGRRRDSVIFSLLPGELSS
jgi:RimJ/RimL family protein N-acetyltransferase